jgi:hypothetical protein
MICGSPGDREQDAAASRQPDLNDPRDPDDPKGPKGPADLIGLAAPGGQRDRTG